MGDVRRKIELFLRGEFFLHLTTMFLIQTIVNDLTSIWGGVFFLPILIGIGKELLDKKEGKQISISDIIGTLVGGYLSILIYY